MSEKTNLGLVNWGRAAVAAGWVYWYGTVGYECTQELYERKRKQYPDHYGNERTEKYMRHIAENRMCADCINLIKAYMWYDEENDKQVYKSNGCPDTNANGMFQRAEVKGVISTMPKTPGLIVRFDGHAGISLGNGYVIEARGFAYGIVLTKLSERPWTHWYKMPGLTYIEDAGADMTDEARLGERVLRMGCIGEDVADLQELLNRYGFDCGEVDGDFGRATERAVKAFQAAQELTADGIYGKRSHEAMMLLAEDAEEKDDVPTADLVEVKGGSVYVRAGSGTSYDKVGIVKSGDRLKKIDLTGWTPVLYNGEVRFISNKMLK